MPARTFADLVNTLPGDQVQLIAGHADPDPECALRRLQQRYQVHRRAGVPAAARAGYGWRHPAECGGFQGDDPQVAFAASTDEARPVLMGVLVNVEKDNVTMAAADGFRLSVRKATLSTPAPQPLNVIIPARALNELARVASDGEELIYMVAAQRARSGGLPREGCGSGLAVDRRDLPRLPADHPALLQIAHPGLHGVLCSRPASRLRSSPAKARTWRAWISNHPTAKCSRAKWKSPPHPKRPARTRPSSKPPWMAVGVLIAFNVKFLREVLEVIKTPNVALETSAANAPGVVRPVGDDNFLHVIMPMHLG